MARRSGAHRVARRSGRGCRRLVRLPSRRGRRSRPGLLVPGPEPGAGEARPLPRGRHPRLGDDRAARARHRCPDGSVGGRRARRRSAVRSRSAIPVPLRAGSRSTSDARGGAAGRDAPRGASRILPALRPDRAGGRRSAARAPPPHARARRVPSLARVCDALPRRLRRPRRPGSTTFETDRTRYLGRGRGPEAPLALTSDTPLSGATGDVLDPILALRRTVEIAPGGAACVELVLAAGHDRGECWRSRRRSPQRPRSIARATRPSPCAKRRRLSLWGPSRSRASSPAPGSCSTTASAVLRAPSARGRSETAPRPRPSPAGDVFIGDAGACSRSGTSRCAAGTAGVGSGARRRVRDPHAIRRSRPAAAHAAAVDQRARQPQTLER